MHLKLRRSDRSFKFYTMYEDVTGPLTVYRNSWFGLVADPMAYFLVKQDKPMLIIQVPKYRDQIIRVVECCKEIVPEFSFEEPRFNRNLIA